MTEDKSEQGLSMTKDCEWVRAIDSNGNSVKIRKVDLIELIRSNMPESTTTNKGLASAFQSLQHFNISPGDSIEFTLDYGIYQFISRQYDGTSLLFQLAYESSNTKILMDPSNINGRFYKIESCGTGTRKIRITNIASTKQQFAINLI